ncbi:MAG: RnfABCDGE type electron transport complex subunit D [Bacteroidetes bacterium]|nr:RnfABCDGE type electron transport complex subunit D [Bacteroidota bacterium]
MQNSLSTKPFLAHLQANWKWFKTDARHFQIVFLSTFLLYGLFELGWQVEASKYAVLISVAVGTQFLFSKRLKIPFSAKSALITALGLCLLFKANSTYTYALAAFVAIAGKFLIRISNKHLFNPANFGVIVPIILTSDGWISPGQWGTGGMLLFLMGVAGMFILQKVKRLETCLTFILVFAGLSFIQNVLYKDWPVDFWLHQFSNGSVLLFTFFMITDPATTPNHTKARLIWAAIIAVASFLLAEYLFVFTAPLWVLFFAAPFTYWFDKKWQATQFSWQPKPDTSKEDSNKPMVVLPKSFYNSIPNSLN